MMNYDTRDLSPCITQGNCLYISKKLSQDLPISGSCGSSVFLYYEDLSEGCVTSSLVDYSLEVLLSSLYEDTVL